MILTYTRRVQSLRLFHHTVEQFHLGQRAGLPAVLLLQHGFDLLPQRGDIFRIRSEVIDYVCEQLRRGMDGCHRQTDLAERFIERTPGGNLAGPVERV